MGWLEWLLLPLVGAVGGFLAGLLGVGGGIIFIPVLTYLFAKEGMDGSEVVKFTLANSILLVFVSGISGIIRQFRTKTILLRKLLVIGIPGAAVSVLWSYFIESGNWYRKDYFQMVFLGFLILSIANMVFHKKEADEIDAGTMQSNYFIELGVAILAGTVVALSGLGGGVIMVPMFRMLLKMPMRQATGLSLSIIPLLSISPLLTYLSTTSAPQIFPTQTGYLVWNYSIPIALCVALFAVLGMRTAKSIPVLVLRIIFATLSAIVFLKTIIDILHS